VISFQFCAETDNVVLFNRTKMDSLPAHISPQQLKGVLDLSRMLAVTTDLEVLLDHIAQAATSLLDCERASIFLHDAQTNELWTKVALHSHEIRVPATAGIVGQAFGSNIAIHVPKPYEDPRFNPEVDRRTGFVTCNLLTAPMVGIDGRPVGVIQAVNKIGDGYSDSDPAILQLLADHAGVAIQRFHLQQAAVERESLRREMDLAKRVQEAMIPEHPPEVPGIAVVGWTQAASLTGGDCFDLWTMPDGRLAIFLADASGHGIGPALIVSQVRAIIRSLVEYETDPAQLLARANLRLCEDLKDGQFVTIFLGILGSDGVLQWTSAGHGPILVRPTATGPVETLDTPTYPLGFSPQWPATAGEPLQLDVGGMLLVATDGIFETFNPAGEQFQSDRVIALLTDGVNRNPPQFLQVLRTAVDAWRCGEEPQDDQTIIVIQRIV